MIKKRGLVTTYVILGIIAAALAVGYFYIRDMDFYKNLSKENVISGKMPEQAQKLKLFVDSCIQDTAQRAVDMASSQSGFITLPSDILPISIINPFSNYLDLFNDGSAIIPYWYYETANGVKKTQVKTMNEISQDIAGFIDKNIGFCINDFDIFRDQGYIISYKPVKSSVRIADEKMFVDTALNINMKKGSFEFNFERFYNSIDSSFGKLYNIAQDIFKKENSDNFIENYALDVMAIYKEIPFSGIDFECAPKTWLKSDVVKSIRQAFALNIPSIKYEGTEYSMNDDFDKYFLVKSKSEFPGVNVNFRYSEDWPIFMDILGEDSDVIKGQPFATDNELGKFVNSLFCINTYQFVYDMKFPVLISLHDENSGDFFQFAVQSIIDNNQPRENKEIPQVLDVKSPICNAKNKRIKVNVLAPGTDNSLRPVADAKVKLKCINSVCLIGNTKLEGPDYSLTADFPQCFNALMTAEKEGFYKGSAQVSTVDIDEVSLIMEPIYELPVEISVITSDGTARPLQPTETAVFQIKALDSYYSTSLIYPGLDKLKLMQGSYEIASQLMVQSDPPFKIEGKELKTCVDAPKGILGLLDIKTKKCITQKTDDLELASIISGTAKTAYSVSRNELSNAKKIRLYVLRTQIPSSLQDLSDYDKDIIQNSGRIKPPELIT